MANMNETKRQPAITASYAWHPGESQANGNTPNGLVIEAPSIGRRAEIILDAISPDIAAWATLHGIKQKLVDAAAISRNPDTGRSATVQDKWAAIQEVFDRITGDNPTWNAIREGGGQTGGLLLAALTRMQPTKTREQLETWLATKSDKEKAALRLNPRVAAVIETIKAERAKVGDVDSDKLLDEIA